MSFVTVAALLVALLVGAPIAAHLLRRRRAEELPFPPAHLVPPMPPAARRRSLLEDRLLFAVRALAIVALAALGATPFVRCSRLSLARQEGASVALAIVVDDSLSMRAPIDGGPARAGVPTKFERAREAARELSRDLAPGDAVAIVLAGAPARVALASTTNAAAMTEAIDALVPSDRATDLEGALRLARDLLDGLAQIDKRVVLLSDRADGQPGAPPLSAGEGVVTWAPVPELASGGADCAVVHADRQGAKVRVRVVCSPAAAPPPAADEPGEKHGAAAPSGEPREPAQRVSASAGRSIELRGDDGKTIASAKLADGLRAEDVTIDLPPSPPESLRAVLTGTDSIAEDDAAPVVEAGGPLPIAVVADAATTRVATGGPPPVEQAFAALRLDAQVRPLPVVPDSAEELAAFAGLLVDDAPGFTPEARRSLAEWVRKGGVAFLTMGPRAASAPLGASFEPLVPGVVRWGDSPVPGIDPATAPTLGPSAESLAALDPRGRATVDPAAYEGADVLAKWRDGAPMLVRRSLGRGAVLYATLPLATDESDLVLRPAFLAVLARFVDTARARGGARRIEVGSAWTFDGFKDVKVRRADARGGEGGEPVAVVDPDGRPRAVPPLAGFYAIELDGERSMRVAAVPEREIDLRPRAVAPAGRTDALGGVATARDASPYFALLVLALFAVELLLRNLGAGARGDEASAA